MSSKQRQTSNQTVNSTTTPNVPSWIEGPYRDFATQVGELAGRNPQDFVTGPSSLQTQAFESAGGLLNNPMWQSILGASGNLALNAASQGPNLAGPVGAPTAVTAGGMPMLPEVAQAVSAGGGGGGTATAGTATAGLASTPVLAPATGYSADKINPNAITVGQTTVGPMAQATSKGLLETNLAGYMDPYLQDVVEATRADAAAREAQQLAAVRAEMMGSGAIRGSGRAVREGILSGENARALASELGKLRSQGYQQAREFATSDLDRFAKTSEFNTGETNKGVLTQAELDSARALKQGDLSTQGLLANLEAENAAREFTAGAQNERDLTQGRIAADVGISNAGNQTQASVATAGNQTQASIASLDANTRAAIASADNATRVALANADSVNRRAELLATLGVDVSKFNAGEINDMAQFVIGQQAETERFNAGQRDEVANRGLTAAGILGGLASTLGSQSRADLETVANLGETQRSIAQQQAGAEPALLAAIAQMLGSIPANTFTGQNTTGTTTGTSTTRSSPGLTDLAQLGMSAAFLFSDERTKRNVETVGYDKKGRRWVDFEYLWDEPGVKHRGVIAQEVARTDPHAVAVNRQGLLGVDYSQLT